VGEGISGIPLIEKYMEITHSYKGLSLAYSQARKGTPRFTSFMISRAGLDKVHVNRPLSIVELGVGSGQQTEFVEKQLNASGLTRYKIIAYDKSTDQLSLLKERMKAGDISDKVVPVQFDFDGKPLPVTAGSVDLIYMAWVFHHLTNQQLVLKEIARVLHKNARIFLYQVTLERLMNHPLDEFFPSKFEYEKKRFPTLLQLKQWFFEAGFTFEKPHVIKKDDPRLIDRAFLESVENTSIDSVLMMIKENDPPAFFKGMKRVKEEVERAEYTGKYRVFNHVDRNVFWGIKR
jgi:SAM-dependent methyltransferase